MSLVTFPRQFLVDANGTPRVGAKANFYASGTVTPITTYTTSAYAVAHANPVLSIAGGLFPAVYINPAVNATYKMVITDSADVTLYTEDNIPALGFTQADIGSILYPQTAAESAAGVTPSNFAYVSGDVRRYGAVGDGTTDESAAIQRAVDVAEVSGGTVYFPPGYKWGMASQVTISSLYPVNLFGEMSVNPTESANASYIRPTGNITGSLFKYVSPTATISEGGAGIISGLSFLDDTDRTRSMTACLDLDSFAAGVIKNCFFHKILGSAILHGYVIQTKMHNIHIRHCGDTSKAAILHRSTGDYQTQGCAFSNIISEVNLKAPHIQLASNTNDCKFIGMTFETTNTADEEFNYITCSGLRNIFVAPTFNSRPAGAYAFEFGSGAGRCSLVAPNCDLGAGLAFLFTGDRNEIRGGYVIAATSTNDPVVFVGVRNRLVGVHFFSTRGFDVNAAANDVTGCIFDTPLDTSGYFLTVTANGEHVNVSANRGLGFPAGLGGINLLADANCNNNVLSGGGGSSVGISVGASNCVVADNRAVNFTTSIDPTTHIRDSIIRNNVGFVTANSGTGAVASGATTAVVTHGLSFTPSLQDITIVFGEQGTNDYGRWSVGTFTSTQFTVTVAADPGASNLDFGWRAGL